MGWPGLPGIKKSARKAPGYQSRCLKCGTACRLPFSMAKSWAKLNELKWDPKTPCFMQCLGLNGCDSQGFSSCLLLLGINGRQLDIERMQKWSVIIFIPVADKVSLFSQYPHLGFVVFTIPTLRFGCFHNTHTFPCFCNEESMALFHRVENWWPSIYRAIQKVSQLYSHGIPKIFDGTDCTYFGHAVHNIRRF